MPRIGACEFLPNWTPRPLPRIAYRALGKHREETAPRGPRKRSWPVTPCNSSGSSRNRTEPLCTRCRGVSDARVLLRRVKPSTAIRHGLSRGGRTVVSQRLLPPGQRPPYIFKPCSPLVPRACRIADVHEVIKSNGSANLRAYLLFLTAILATHPIIGGSHDNVRVVVNDITHPLMKTDGITGIAVGVVIDGRSRVFDDGVASLHTHSPVTAHTVFEIDSTCKNFTATLVSYAVVTGRMAPTDKVGHCGPSLRGRTSVQEPIAITRRAGDRDRIVIHMPHAKVARASGARVPAESRAIPRI
ncbi:MAG: serine hydrolase [Gallionella sp.]|nr:serine hydrolase [Gallionella sp.]